MPNKTERTIGLPSRQQILDFIAQSAEPAGKREIARAFKLHGQEKIQLKALLKDMADEGLIDGKRTAFHRMGGVPRVTVLRVVDIEDGEAIAIPDTWQPDDGTLPPHIDGILSKPPRIQEIRSMLQHLLPNPPASSKKPGSRRRMQKT